MSLQRIQTNKEFSRDVVVGMITIVSLFAILLFVAVQRFTGRSISPLAYLYAQPEKESHSIPVKVFATEDDRLAARAVTKNQPSFDVVAKKISQISESLRNNDDPQEKSIQLVSYQNEVSGKEADANQMIKSSSFPAAPSIRSFQPRRPSTSTNQFNPQSIPKTSAEIPSNFQPSSGMPSTSPPTVAVQPFPNDGNVTRFQSPESAATQNPAMQTRGADNLISNSPTSNSSVSASESLAPSTHDFHVSEISKESSSKLPVVTNRQQSFAVKAADESSVVANDSASNATKSTRPDKRIQPKTDDSFWTIANREYGDGELFRQLAVYNKCLENSDIMPRAVLIPDLETLQSVKVEIESDRMLDDTNSDSSKRLDSKAAENQSENKSEIKYVVQDSDTLFEISKQELGQAVRYVEIIRLNQGILPANVDGETKLQIGLELIMPE